MAKKKQTIKDIRNKLNAIGDSAKSVWDKTQDLNAGKLAVKAYSETYKTSVAQLRYKELTGSPTKIEFLED